MADNQEHSLKILITAMFSTGHLNACLGIGSLLIKRGHDVYFAHYPESQPIIEKNGMKFLPLTGPQRADKNIMKEIPKTLKAKLDNAMKYSPLELIKNDEIAREDNLGLIAVLEMSKEESLTILKIIDEVKPHLCLADYLWVVPWMVKVDIPVVPIMSTAPNDLYNGPPLMSDYSVNDSPELWAEYRFYAQRARSEMEVKRKELFEFFDVQYVPWTYAKQLGIYIYPGPLDYTELGPPKKNWVRLDSSIRLSESSDFIIPDKIADKPGKLIYLSMGTLASQVSEVMNMILEPLAAVPHRFIISTGAYGDSVKLYDNMWGDKFINQIALLPHVDLFITHGGSNSLIEGLIAGIPLVVIPQFGDQLNNGQRIVDLKLGTKINLWEFSGDKLIKAIDYVLDNEEIRQNVLKTSEELKKSDSSDKVCALIEELGRTKALPS